MIKYKKKERCARKIAKAAGLEEMKIGNIDLGLGLSLAPMAGFSDRAMRKLCHDHGADYSVSEMISAKAVVYGDKKTFSLAKICEDEGPVGLQIFGKEPEIMAQAAKILTDNSLGAPPAFIDINMGCPVHKIFSNGEGSALMKDPGLIERIVYAVKSSVELPVTVKIRKGIDDSCVNAVECAKAAEAGGADALCIHGRTRVQMYSGVSDRKIIEKVKYCLQIPLIANGDITSGDEALRMIYETGADGVAVGRGAVGNPFIFEEIRARLLGKEYAPPSLKDRIDAALLQLRLAVEEKGERVAVCEARKQIALYLKGFRGAAEIRGRINTAVSYSEVEELFLSLVK